MHETMHEIVVSEKLLNNEEILLLTFVYASHLVRLILLEL